MDGRDDVDDERGARDGERPSMVVKSGVSPDSPWRVWLDRAALCPPSPLAVRRQAAHLDLMLRRDRHPADLGIETSRYDRGAR